MKLPRLRIPYWQLIAIPLLLWFVGVGSNQLVLIANWGKFPVMYNDYYITLFRAEEQRICAPVEEKKPELPFWLREAARLNWAAPTPHSPDKFSAFDTSVSMTPVCQAMMQNGQFTDNVHTIMGHNSRLKFMADIFNMGAAIYSIGDFFILLALYLGDMAGLAWIVLILRKFNEVTP